MFSVSTGLGLGKISQRFSFDARLFTFTYTRGGYVHAVLYTDRSRGLDLFG